MTDVVCLGILVADVARPVDELPPAGALKLVEEISLHGGGCALNTASAPRSPRAHGVGGREGGRDSFGDFVLQLLDERGVARCGVLQDEKVPTSATVVLVDSAGERTFLHLLERTATCGGMSSTARRSSRAARSTSRAPS